MCVVKTYQCFASFYPVTNFYIAKNQMVLLIMN